MSDAVTSRAWERHCLDLFGFVHFLKNSGRFTLFAPGNLGKGDFNVYRMFAELALRHARAGGGVAQVLPGGIYGGANASAIRKFMFDECELKHLFGLINTQRRWFPEVDIDRFGAVAVRRGGRTSRFLASFGLKEPADLARDPIDLDAEVVRAQAPNTYAIPDMRSDAEVTMAATMYARHPAFGDGTAGPPHRHYQREVDMGTDNDLFGSDPDGLPVYEGRMIWHYDHRAKTYESGHGNSAVWRERLFGDPAKAIVPQWRVKRSEVPGKLGDRTERYRIGFADVANPRNERSVTATLIPPSTICGHTVPTIVFDTAFEWAYLPWLAVSNSFVMDALTRKKLSSPHLTYTVLDGLPFPRPTREDAWVRRVIPLVLRLVCTAPEMTHFWNTMASLGLCAATQEGRVPDEALLDETERDHVRAEVDALVARDVYGLTRVEVSAALDTFPIVKKRDLKAHGEFRTQRLILEAYDALARVAVRVITQPVSHVATPVRLRRVQTGREDRYRTCVPLLSLRAAAGGFSDVHAPEFEDWVEVPGTPRLAKGMFVAQVVGRSMEPLIPNGAYCLFKQPVTGTRQGRVVLVEHRDIHDPDTGGSYTVKRYASEKTADAAGGWRHTEIRLLSQNPEFEPIVLTDVDEGSVSVVAEFIAVVGTDVVEEHEIAPRAAAGSTPVPVVPSRGEQVRPALAAAAAGDLARLPNGAWGRPGTDLVAETGAALAAVLKAARTLVPARQVRLAVVLALEPRLLTGVLSADDAAAWRRLVGAEAAPLANGVLPFVPVANVAWGEVVRQFRATDVLVEDATTRCWGPGASLGDIETGAWPDGRAGFVMRALSQVGIAAVVSHLPQTIREWVDAEAA